MPELPEVETVVRELRSRLCGHTITGVRQSQQQLRRPWRARWNAAVTGMRIEELRRRGKWILLDLAGPAGDNSPPSRHASLGRPTPPARQQPVLRIHLGMSGRLTVAPATEAEPDHLHVAFTLDNNTELRFRDPRRFGCVEYFPDRAAIDTDMNAQLGPEPFAIDPDVFRAAVRGTSRVLKAILLDQHIVAGIGNIYADEVLFRVKLHPQRPGQSLTPAECDRLREAIPALLTRAIESRGSTIRDYIGGSGESGTFQNELAVYGRTGQPCRECGTAIECLRLAGRSSHFCPRCQRSGFRIRDSGSGKNPKPRRKRHPLTKPQRMTSSPNPES